MGRMKERAPAAMDRGLSTHAQLRSYVERLVRLEEDKKDLASDIRDVKAEAKSNGYDTKVLNQMVREAMMDQDQRDKQREFEEICEVYRASLGMLQGTPLGDSARKRASAMAPDKETSAPDAPAEETASPPPPPEGLDEARDAGRTAARNRERIFANPHISGDPRRAAWDEGWCEVSGSDGMEIPEAWRRRPKKTPDRGAPLQ